MGTSANLWVKSGSKHYVQHTSYDGHVDRVFAALGASIAACGLEALRASFDRAVIAPDDGDMEETRGVSFGIAAPAYLDACQARGREPFLLMSALRDPDRMLDFAHAGVLPLLGSPLVSDPDFCRDASEADFVLDLDAGTLSALAYEQSPQDPSREQTVPFWTMDLVALQACDPECIFQQIQEADFDYEAPAPARQEFMDKLMATIAATAPEASSRQAAYDIMDVDDMDGPSAAAGCHQFITGADNAPALRMMISLLQRCAVRAPVLGQPGVLLAQMVPDAQGGISLSVDLRNTPVEQLAGLGGLFSGVGQYAKTVGLTYMHGNNGAFSMQGDGMMMSSFSIGGPEDLEADDDEFAEFDRMFGGFGMQKVEPPNDAVPVRTQAARLADIDADIASMDEEAIGFLREEKMMARANLDGEILARIPASIHLSKEQTHLSNALLNLFGVMEDMALPGARRERFLALPGEVQEEIKASFNRVGRYVFCEDLGLAETPARPPRRPAP